MAIKRRLKRRSAFSGQALSPSDLQPARRGRGPGRLFLQFLTPMILVLGTLLGPIASAGIGLGSSGIPSAAAAPGSPGNPQAGTVVYNEDFENAGSTAVGLLSYTGGAAAQGETYTADPYWTPAGNNCNGWDLSGSTPLPANAVGCTAGSWAVLQDVTTALGEFAGQSAAAAANNRALSEYTTSAGTPGIELQTATNQIPAVAGHYYDVRADYAAIDYSGGGLGCATIAGFGENDDPQINLYLLDGANRVQVGSQLNPCTAPGNRDINVAGGNMRVAELVSNALQWTGGSVMGVQQVNANGNGNYGNDGATDNIQIVDVTPQLDKAFSPAKIDLGDTSTLTFTVTNTSELGAKDGWSFTDNLPTGLMVATNPGTATTCTNGSVNATAGGTSVQFAGDLNQGQQSCTLSVDVTSTIPGTYTNDAKNVSSANGVNTPGSATLTVSSGVASSLTKSGTDTNTNSTADTATGAIGTTQPGDTINWTLHYGNNTGAPATVNLTDPFTGQAYVANSLKLPPGLNPQYSTDGGNSYISGNPPANANGVGATGTLPPNGTGATAPFSPTATSATGVTTRGDGFLDIFYGANVYNLHHHVFPGELENGLPLTLIDCHVVATGAECPGYAGGGLYANSTAGSAFSTNVADDNFTTMSSNWSAVNQSNGKLYFATTIWQTGNYGVGCLDLSNNTSCGFTQLGTGPGNSTGIYQGWIVGGAIVGNDYWLLDYTGHLVCFDITSATTCGSIAAYDTSFPNFVHMAAAQAVNWGGSAYVFTWVTSSTTQNVADISCVNVATGTRCPGYPVAPSADNGNTLLPVLSSSGAIAGVCAEWDATPAVAATRTFACYDTSGNPIATPKPYSTLPASTSVGPWPNYAGSTVVVGTKLYYVADTGSSGAVGDPMTYQYQCYDAATGAACAGFSSPLQSSTWASNSPTDFRVYTIDTDPYIPGCMAEDGDAGIIQYFDATTGALGCSGMAANVSVTPSAFYCSTTPANLTWNQLQISGIASNQYSGATYTISDKNGNPVTGFANQTLTPGQTTVDISAIPVSGATSSLSVAITLANPANGVTPSVSLTFNGPPIEICYQTTVPNVCPAVGTTLNNTGNAVTTGTNGVTDGPDGTSSGEATFNINPTTAECAFTVTKKASENKASPGDAVTYTITVTNTGTAAWTGDNPAGFTDDISNVLNDAVYNNDAAITPAGDGTVGYNAPNLTWSGPLGLAPNDTVTITYSVKVNNPDTGAGAAHKLVNTVTPTCPSYADCGTPTTVTVNISGLVITKSVSPSDGTAVNPGDSLTYTLTFDNTAGTAAANVPAGYIDTLTDVVDDATVTQQPAQATGTGLSVGPVTTTGGTTYFTIGGTVPAGTTSTVTYKVQVKNPDTNPPGNQELVDFVSQGPPTSTTCQPNDPTCTNNPVTPPPPTITVKKQVAGRADPSDQFIVSLNDATGAVLGSAQTSGTQTMATSNPAGVTVGSTYTIIDAMANGSANPLSSYTASIVCTDTTMNTTVTPTGSGPNWSLNVTAADNYTCTVTNAAQPQGNPWVCSVDGYLFQTPAANTHTITTVDLTSGATQPAGNTPDNVNAVGYNTLDDFMYGYDLQSDTIVKISSDGSLISLGLPSGITAQNFNVGDFDNAGHLWIMNTNIAAGGPWPWAEIDLSDPTSNSYGTLIDSGTATHPTGLGNMNDWAHIGGFFYGVAPTSDHTGNAHLLRFNPANGNLIDLTAANGLPGVPSSTAAGNAGYGAAYADAAGNLYVEDNASGGIYRVDVTALQGTKIATGPTSSNNDGARCATAAIPTITVKKTVAGRVNPKDNFTVGLNNSTGAVLTSATTTGTGTSATTTNFPVSQGTTYTITDAMAAGPSVLTDYAQSIVCADDTGAQITPIGTGPSWQFTVPGTGNYTCTITNTPHLAALTITKSVTPDDGTTVDPGTSLTYTLTFDNSNGSAAAQIPTNERDTLTDVLDDAMLTQTPQVQQGNGSTVAAGAIVGTLANPPIYFPITGSVAAGDTATVTYTVQVNDPDTTGNGALNDFISAGPPPVICNDNDPTCTHNPVTPPPPPTITVKKQVAGRVAPSDQFIVSLNNSSSSVLATAMTNGAETTATSAAASVAAGSTYTIIDAMANGSANALTSYQASIECTDTTTHTSVTTQGTSPNWTFSVPAGAADNYSCTVTNTAKAAGSPWVCSVYGYLFQSPNGAPAGPHSIYQVDLPTGAFTTFGSTPNYVNAIGYNVTDNYLYGISVNADASAWSLVKIANDGTTTSLGQPAGMTTNVGGWAAGEVDPDGNYWTLNQTAGNVWYEVDVNPNTANYGKLIDSGTFTVPTGITNIGGDWSWINGDLYMFGLDGAAQPNSHLLQFDPTTGDLTNLGRVGIPAGTGNAIGATYTDGTYLYGSVNSNGFIYRVDPTTRDTILVTDQGPASSNNDGARCPTAAIPTLTVSKVVDGRVNSNDQFIVSLNNSTGAVLTSATTDDQHLNSVSTTNFPVNQGTTYTIVDAMANGSASQLTDYTQSIVCQDATGTQIVPTGTGPSWQFTVPGTSDYTCTITNTAQVQGNPWVCSVNGYLFQTPAADTHQIVQVNLATGAASQIGTTPDNVNAVGFNTLDDFMYGYDIQNDTIVKISSDGSFISLGLPSGLTAQNFNVGDFDASGHLWIMNTNIAAGGPWPWAEIDLSDPTSNSYGTVIDSGMATRPTGLNPMNDWAYVNGRFYGVAPTSDHTGNAHLLRFNPNNGNLVDLTAANGLPGVPSHTAAGNAGYGAAYADAANNLYVQDNTSGRIYRIDVTALQGTKIATGPASSNNDGARCATASLPTITVAKQVAGRVNPNDQFTVGLNDSTDAVLTSATTGAQPDPDSASTTDWPVSAGSTYTITDAMAAGPSTLADYQATIVCTDETTGNTVTTGGSAPSWTLAIPTDGTDDYTCTITNTPHVANLTITKSVTPPDGQTVDPGTSLTYTLTFDNSNGSAAAQIPNDYRDTLTDVLDDATITQQPQLATGSGLTVGAITGTAQNPPIYFPITGSVPAHSTATVTYTVKVNDPDVAPGNQSLNDFISSGPPNGNCTIGDSDCTINPVTPAPNLQISKTANPVSGTIVNPGDQVSYTLTFDNTTGTADATIPTGYRDNLTDVVDDATVSTPAVHQPQGSNVTLNPITTVLGETYFTINGTVAAGQTVTVTYAATVNDPDIAPGNHQLLDFIGTTNNPPVTCQPNDPTCTYNPITPAPNLQITKSSNPATTTTVNPGDSITYTLTFDNTTGTSDATIPANERDWLTDVLDDATLTAGPTSSVNTVTVGSMMGSANNPPVFVPISGTVAAGTSATVTYTVKVNTPDTGNQDLVDFLAAGNTPPTNCDPASQTCTDHPVSPLANLTITKTADPANGTTVNPGDTVTYTLTFDNSTGTADASIPNSYRDTLTDVVDDASVTTDPAQATGPDSLSVGSVVTVSGVTSFPISGTVTAGNKDTVTYTVTVNDPDTGNHNLVDVISAGSPPNCTRTGCTCPQVSDGTCTINPVNKAPALVVSKSASPQDGTIVNPGDTVSYTLTFDNSKGTADATIPANNPYIDTLTDVSDDATVSTPVRGQGNLTVGALQGNPPASFTVSGTVPAGTVATVTYTAKVNDPDTGNHDLIDFISQGTPPNVCNPGDPTCTSHPVNPAANLQISKSVNPQNGSTVDPGDTLTYTLHFDNSQGSADALIPLGYIDTLTDVVDDATLTSGPTASAGSGLTLGPVVKVNGVTTFSISGSVPAGVDATVTYTVKVNTPDTGNQNLVDFVSRGTPPDTCVPANDPACTINPVTPAPNLIITKTADPQSTTTVNPNDAVTYTVTFDNSKGTADATVPANYKDVLTDVLDDANLTNGPTVTQGNLTLGTIQGSATNPPAFFTVSGSVGAGTIAKVSYTVTVNNPDTGNHSLLDFVGTSTTPPANCQPTDLTCTINPVTKTPNLVITKTVDPQNHAMVNPGDQLTYTLTFDNTNGAADATIPANYIDTLSDVVDDATVTTAPAQASGPDNLVVGSPVTVNGNTTFSISGTVAAGSKDTVTYTVTVKNPDTGNHNLVNVLSAGPPPNCTRDQQGVITCTCQTNDQTCTTNPVTPTPNLTITKSVDPQSGTTVNSGDKLTYTLVFDNTTGTADAQIPAGYIDTLTDVVDDAQIITGPAQTLGTGLTVGSPITVGGQTTFGISGSIPAGKVYKVSYTVQVNTPDTGNGNLVDFISAGTPPANCDPATQTCTTNPVTPEADLELTKTGPASVDANGQITYNITVVNHGPNDAVDSVVTDNLPSGLTDVSDTTDTGTCNIVNGTMTCELGTLASGATVNITVTGTAPATSGQLQNTASVTSTTHDPDPNNNSDGVTTKINPAEADLQVVKTGPAQVAPNGVVSYTITVTNNGPDAAQNAQAIDQLPAQLSDVQASASNGGTCPISSTTMTCDLGTLADGETVLISVTGTAPDTTAQLTNTVDVKSTTPDPDPSNNNSTVTTGVVTPPPAEADLELHKTGPASVDANGVVTYTIKVTNNGPDAAENAKVVDALPVALTDVTVTTSLGSCSQANTTLSCTLGTMAKGQEATIVVVGTAPATAQDLTNSATVTSTTADPDPNNNSDKVTTTITQTPPGEADIQVVKDCPATISTGGLYTCQIKVTNNGPDTAENVQLNDQLPAGLTNVSATSSQGDCSVDGSNLHCSLGTLASGHTVTIVVTGTAPADAATLTNTASATSSTSDPNLNNNEDTVTTNVTTGPAASADLKIVKSGPSSVSANGTVTYSITVTNNGPDAAQDAVVTDLLPPALANVNATPSQGSCSQDSTTLTCDLGNIGVGSSVTITVTGKAPATSQQLTNDASVTSKTSDPDPDNNDSKVTTNVTTQQPGEADLQIQKTGPATVSQNGIVSYQILVTNNGPSTAENAQVTDNLPSGLTDVQFHPSQGSCSNDNGTLSCNLGTLANGSSATIVVSGTAPNHAATLVNDASVTSSTSDPNPDNNESKVTTTIPAAPAAEADLQIAKTGPATVEPDGTVTYEITVTNNGPDTAENAVVTDLLPAGLTDVQATPSQGTCSNEARTLTCQLGTIPNGETITVPVSGKAPAGAATLTNLASVTSSTSDPNSNNNQSSVTTDVTPNPAPQADLSLVKTGPTTVGANGTVSYTITVTNSGPDTAENAVVTDNLPDGLTGASASASQGSCSQINGSLTCNLGSIAPSGTATVTVTGTAPANTGTLTNSATVTSTTADPNANNNSSSVSTTITSSPSGQSAGQADLQVTKTGPATTAPNGTVSYTITVTNLGPDPAQNVVVTDNLPPHLSNVSATSSQGSCSQAGTTLTCTLNAVPNGGIETITVTGTAPDDGQFSNTASVTSTTGDPNQNNNQASVTTNVNPGSNNGGGNGNGHDHGHGHGHGHGNGNGNGNHNGNGNGNGNHNGNGNGNGNHNGNGNSNSNGNGNSNSNGNGNSNSNGNGNSNSNGNGNNNTNANGNGNGNVVGNGNTNINGNCNGNYNCNHNGNGNSTTVTLPGGLPNTGANWIQSSPANRYLGLLFLGLGLAAALGLVLRRKVWNRD